MLTAIYLSERGGVGPLSNLPKKGARKYSPGSETDNPFSIPRHRRSVIIKMHMSVNNFH